MINYADSIKSAVSMPDLLERYGLPVSRHRRIPCPIHNGTKSNFAYKEHGFNCYVCGVHGDVITFTELYFGLDFMDACRKLDQDFNLGLNVGGTLDAEKQAEAERVSMMLRAKRERREAERKRVQEAYHAALDRWCELDKAIRNGKPRTPYDDLTERYAYAVKNIDAAGAALDEAEINLWEFEHEGEKAYTPVSVQRDRGSGFSSGSGGIRDSRTSRVG